MNHVSLNSVLALRFFGTCDNEVEAKQFNVFLGVSLGNKHLNTRLAKRYLEYALGCTKQKVAVLIADDIDAVNWTVYRGFTEAGAFRKVAEKARQLENIFRRAIRQLSHERGADLDQVVGLVRWREILGERYLFARRAMDEQFQSDRKFRDRVLSFVDSYASRRNRYFRADSLERLQLAEYVLAELPTLVQGIDHRGTSYEMVLYPTFKESGMSQFALDIQQCRYQPLGEKLGSEAKAVLVEALVEERV